MIKVGITGETKDVVNESNIAKMDFHGAKITVISANDPTIVGETGRVIRDNYGTLMIINEDKQCKLICKKGTLIELQTPSNTYEINLTGMMCRPSQRPTKRWKLRIPVDLPY